VGRLRGGVEGIASFDEGYAMMMSVQIGKAKMTEGVVGEKLLK
jgi:hypothetical protein